MKILLVLCFFLYFISTSAVFGETIYAVGIGYGTFERHINLGPTSEGALSPHEKDLYVYEGENNISNAPLFHFLSLKDSDVYLGLSGTYTKQNFKNAFNDSFKSDVAGLFLNLNLNIGRLETIGKKLFGTSFVGLGTIATRFEGNNFKYQPALNIGYRVFFCCGLFAEVSGVETFNAEEKYGHVKTMIGITIPLNFWSLK